MKSRIKLHVLLCTACFLITGFSGCTLESLLYPDGDRKSDFRRDIEFRGPDSQKAWLEATGGSYNGNLPRE